MDRETRSQLAHAGHPVAAPVGDPAVERLIGRALALPAGAAGSPRLLDLGCGRAEWLLRALAAHPTATAHGVDVSAPALAAARAAAEARGLTGRLSLHQVPAAEHADPDPYDVVLSVGATHAFGGGLAATLDAAGRHLAPGGHLVLGHGYWERPPGPEVVELLGDHADLPGTLDLVTAAGWTPVYGHVSSREELDDYEWSWTGSLAAWALDHPQHPDHAEALAAATAHRTEWLTTYRGVWGFVTLVLRR
ncbi:SAM-dependent methyltransferase [Streptomyces antimicrobicus]|uniref:Class I SAM-dependent methyltransferase n=1 Tax=Streptomyces antimicrobicus TaxID=2883108 RepID=A0ABS8B7P0_9ACTN|nr:class I SAM-dependent methyltransferase [Streptomyces antimicrobicus]MCB5180593.1 class I SAM-dependent methyltransferase [Streptomyces antimicrobicus]